VLEEHPLDPAVHDRKGFDCGVPVFNAYLQNLAEQHRRKGITAVYVLVAPAAPSIILGYYTLGAAEVDALHLADADRKRPAAPPCAVLPHGTPGLPRRPAGSAAGQTAPCCAVDRCMKARTQVAAYALIVDAKDTTAKAFYEHYGFTPLADQPLTLYLPLGR